MRALFAIIRVTSAADAFFQCLKRMFHPGLANLFEALVVTGAAAHPIKILRNNRVIVTRRREPIDRLVPIVTRICSDTEAYLRSNNLLGKLGSVLNLSNNHVRAGYESRRFSTRRTPHCPHDG